MRRLSVMFAVVGLGCWLVLAAGCGPYVLEGKVVEGDASAVQAVTADDPRLEKPGLGEARIELTLDPESLGREDVASRRVRPDGTFAIPINVFGAGWMEHEFGALVRQEGYSSAYRVFMLPGGDQKLLVTLKEGRDAYKDPDEALEDSRRFLPDSGSDSRR